MKKILLITTNLNGYEEKIIEELKKRNFEVDFFKEGSKINRRELTVFQRIIRGIAPKNFYIKKIEKKIYSNYISKLRESYDYIFDFGGKVQETCVVLLKEKYKATYILYMWDDLKYMKNVWKIMRYFEKKYIFNNLETEKYGFEYRPNFYVNDYLYDFENKEIDIYYKGNLRDKKRTIILEAIEEELKNYKSNISLYAKGSYFKNIKKVHSFKYFKEHCNSEFVSLKDLSKNYKKAKILLDIAYKNQSGLGLRPLEAIAANCKLITTNENIKSYEFYNENNIFYLKEDLSNISEMKEFVEKEFVVFPDEVKYRYSIGGFIDDIFGRK